MMKAGTGWWKMGARGGKTRKFIFSHERLMMKAMN